MAGALCLAAIVAVGIWYKLEGYALVSALLLHRPARASQADDLPALYLEISPQAYQRMYRQWHESLRTGIPRLDEGDWVQGQIHFQGQAFPVSLWLQEVPAEHWQESKWSLQIALRGEAGTRRKTTILGMRSFVARSPAARRYLDDWLYAEDLRRAGILAPRYVFAHLWVNGDDWGIYALQEEISDPFFAAQERPTGVVIRVDDSLPGRQRAWLESVLSGDGDLAAAAEWPGLVRVDEGQATQVEHDPALQEQSAAALGLLRAFQGGQLPPSQVFDPELLGRYLAHAHWWGARYGTKFEGERYYYHPLTSRLEPLGGDMLPLEPAYAHLPSLAQYDDMQVMQAYAREVQRIAQPEYLEALREVYRREFRRYQAALAREFSAPELAGPWQMLSERQAILYHSLHPPQTAHAYRASQGGSSSMDVHVGNLSTYPLVLDQIQVGDRAVKVQRDWFAAGQDALLHSEAMTAVVLRPIKGIAPRYVTLGIPQSALDELFPLGETPSGKLQLATHVAGVDRQVMTDVQLDDLPALSASAPPARPSVEEALARHPFLTRSERPGFLRLKPGDWDVAGDLVLPDRFGLQVSQPTTLHFDPGTILLANGPLLLHGSADGEIAFLPKGEDWGGIVVLDAGDEIPSSLSYVTVRAATGVHRNGWYVPGGMTFYRSPVAMAHCRLLDALAQRALYVAHAHFECAQVEFGRVSAHALYSEYAEGLVHGCAFHDVLGNALHVRGSRVDVRDVSLLRVYDHGISASQNSVVTVEGGRMQDVGIAIASSDMSHAHVQDVHVVQAWKAGLAAYTGELGSVAASAYGPASIWASGVVFEDDDTAPHPCGPQTLAQQGSSVRLEGIAASAQELGIEGTCPEPVEGLRWREEISTTIRPLSYRLGPAIWLVGYDVTTPELARRQPLRIVLYWRTTQTLDLDYTIFLHIWDASGETVAGWDTMPRENTFPTTQWPAGQVIDDAHIVPLDIPSGEYQLALGMYYWPTGERLPASDPGGEPVPNGVIALERRFRVK